MVADGRLGAPNARPGRGARYLRQLDARDRRRGAARAARRARGDARRRRDGLLQRLEGRSALGDVPPGGAAPAARARLRRRAAARDRRAVDGRLRRAVLRGPASGALPGGGVLQRRRASARRREARPGHRSRRGRGPATRCGATRGPSAPSGRRTTRPCRRPGCAGRACSSRSATAASSSARCGARTTRWRWLCAAPACPRRCTSTRAGRTTGPTGSASCTARCRCSFGAL